MKIRTLLSLVIMIMLSACEQAGQPESVGKKLMPPKPLTDMVLVDDQNNALPIDLLKNSYHYVLLAESACDEFCMQYIDLTREAIQQTSTDHSAPMAVSKPVKQLLVLGYEPDKAWLEKLKQENPGITVTVLTPAIWSIFTLPFNQVATDMVGSPLFLVDPRGFIMIVYDDLDESAPLVSDLRSLDAQP